VKELIPGCKALPTAELDERLERAVQQNERSERKICAYLLEMNDRRGHESYGFANIFDYAAERFGFSERKTAYLTWKNRRGTTRSSGSPRASLRSSSLSSSTIAPM